MRGFGLRGSRRRGFAGKPMPDHPRTGRQNFPPRPSSPVMGVLQLGNFPSSTHAWAASSKPRLENLRRHQNERSPIELHAGRNPASAKGCSTSPSISRRGQLMRFDLVEHVDGPDGCSSSPGRTRSWMPPPPSISSPPSAMKRSSCRKANPQPPGAPVKWPERLEADEKNPSPSSTSFASSSRAALKKRHGRCVRASLQYHVLKFSAEETKAVPRQTVRGSAASSGDASSTPFARRA